MEEEAPPTHIFGPALKQWSCGILGFTGDREIHPETEPGQPPQRERPKQVAEHLEVRRGDLGEGQAVDDSALCGGGLAEPDYPALGVDRSPVREEAEP